MKRLPSLHTAIEMLCGISKCCGQGLGSDRSYLNQPQPNGAKPIIAEKWHALLKHVAWIV